MASKTQTKEKKSPTEDIVLKCKRDLCEEKVSAGSEKAASETEVKSGIQNKQYKICSLAKAEETYSFYRNFKYCIGRRSSKDAEQIQAKIKDLIEKDNSLKGLFKDLVKMIKDTKSKMAEALEVACRLDRCKEEEQRCNLDIYKALQKGIPDIWDRFESAKSDVEDCYGKITQAFDSAIDISGILTFSDIESLGALGDSLNDLIAQLVKDCEDNMKLSISEESKANDELLKNLDDLSISRFKHCMATAKEEGLCNVFEFICDPNCDDKNPERIREICEKFTDDLPLEDQDDPCDDLDNKPPNQESSEWSMKDK